MRQSVRLSLFALLFALALVSISRTGAAELKVGTASVDFTPPKPVALDGQMGTRISKEVLTPITANIVALEGVDASGKAGSCIVVSCDMVGIRPEFEDAIRAELKKVMPEFDPHRVMLCATHTHTAPVADVNKYYIAPGTDCMRPNEFVVFAGQKIAPAIARAWNARKPVQYSYGLGSAQVAQNRRSVFADGTGCMYGKTNRPDFRAIEGYEDRSVNVMFFWDKSDKLIAALVNVSCPAQEVEGMSSLHADYWHYVRKYLHEIWGEDVAIVALCGAAGDMSPHTQYRANAENRMTTLRGLSRVEEIGRRVAAEVSDLYDIVKLDKSSDIVFGHAYAELALPQYRITEKEYGQSKAESARQAEAMKKNPNAKRLHDWADTIVTRYEAQRKDAGASFRIPVHVMRIGETALCSNPFELFTSYGTRIKARSPARQTFVVQLTDGCGICGTASSAGYLPTAEAYRHGGYSAIVKSITVGPDGGDLLVEDTLDMIAKMFKEEKKRN